MKEIITITRDDYIDKISRAITDIITSDKISISSVELITILGIAVGKTLEKHLFDE